MAELKPAYLFTGTDLSRIDAVRKRLRQRVAEGGGAATLEIFEGARCRPELVAQALTALSLATGTRHLLVDGVETWRAGDLKPVVAALKQIPPATVLVFLGRGKVPAALGKAVLGAGGEVKTFEARKPSELPGWVRATAAGLGLELDLDTAEALVARIGTGQARLQRELEKLALYASSGEASHDELLAAAAQENEARAYELADALLSGARPRAVALAVQLRAQGETVPGLMFALLRQLRTVLAASEGLAAGLSPGEVQGDVRLAPDAARRVVRQAQGTDPASLRAIVCRLADLDEAVKGGSALADDTALTLALAGGNEVVPRRTRESRSA